MFKERNSEKSDVPKFPFLVPVIIENFVVVSVWHLNIFTVLFGLSVITAVALGKSLIHVALTVGDVCEGVATVLPV